MNFEDGYDEVPEAWEVFLRKPVRVEALRTVDASRGEDEQKVAPGLRLRK